MDGRQTPSAVDALRAAVDGLLSLELAAVPSVEVAALLTELEV
jgi:hypothetical protein